MDSTLKEILREERKRNSERERNKDRTHKFDKEKTHDKKEKTHDKKGKTHDREKEKTHHREQRNREEKDRNERRDKRNEKEIDEKNLELSVEVDKNIETSEIIDDGIERFMFLFEDKNGKIFSSLKSIEPEENDEVKIFPVYVTGYNSNLNEEIITYKNKWVSSEENIGSSWLNVLGSVEPGILIVPFENEDIVVYNSRFFHCEKDLFEFLEENGAEYLQVSHS